MCVQCTVQSETVIGVCAVQNENVKSVKLYNWVYYIKRYSSILIVPLLLVIKRTKVTANASK